MVERSIKELLCLACQLVQKLRIRACRQAERKDFLSGIDDRVYTEQLTGLLSGRNKGIQRGQTTGRVDREHLTGLHKY